MKNTLKRMSVLMVVCMLALLVAACGNNTGAPETTTPPEVSSFDFSAYPADFNDWTSADMKTYLTEAGLLANEKFILMDLSAGDIEVMKATAGFLYVDGDAGSVCDTVFVYDTNDADAKSMYDSILEYQAIVIDGDVENGIPVDAVLGNFCFSYLLATDDTHIDTFIQCIRDLSAHYNVEAAYING